MKRNSFFLALAATCIASCASTSHSSDHDMAEHHAGMGDVQEMAMPQATEHHRKMYDAVGEWKGTLTMSMPGASTDPMPCRETISRFGDFWITSEFHSDFMGMPFQGRAVQGYDVHRGKYVGTWIDTMSGHLSLMEGHYDPTTGHLIMEWEAPDMTGQMAPHRSATEFNGDQTTMTFWTRDMQTMVIEMHRQ